MSTPEPKSIGKVMVETREAMLRYHEASVNYREACVRIWHLHPDHAVHCDSEVFAVEVPRLHFRQREAELIRAILAWRPSHVETVRGEPCEDGDEWEPRGVTFEGFTHVIWRDTRREDDDDDTVSALPVLAHQGDAVRADMVWRLAVTLTDYLIALDDAFGD